MNFLLLFCVAFKRSKNEPVVNEVRPVVVGTNKEAKFYLKLNSFQQLLGKLSTAAGGTALVDGEWQPCIRFVNETNVQEHFLPELERLFQQAKCDYEQECRSYQYEQNMLSGANSDGGL